MFQFGQIWLVHRTGQHGQVDCGLASRLVYKQQKTHTVEDILDFISMHEKLFCPCCLFGGGARRINQKHWLKQEKGERRSGEGW